MLTKVQTFKFWLKSLVSKYYSDTTNLSAILELV